MNEKTAIPPRRALIAGSSGLIGGFLLAELLARPQFGQVYSLVRRASGQSHPKLTELQADFAHLDYLDIPALDDAFVALGTTIRIAGSQEAFRRVDFDAIVAVARRAHAAGARRLIVVSSIGADAASSNFYLKTKGQTEDVLAGLGFAELHLLRPSMLYGPRRENRPAEKLGILFSRALAPLLIGPLAQYKPIAAQVVGPRHGRLRPIRRHGCRRHGWRRHRPESAYLAPAAGVGRQRTGLVKFGGGSMRGFGADLRPPYPSRWRPRRAEVGSSKRLQRSRKEARHACPDQLHLALARFSRFSAGQPLDRP